MPRRRNFIARPHDHLSAAAQVHALLATGESVAAEDSGAGNGEASKPKGRGQTDRARDTRTGRFK